MHAWLVAIVVALTIDVLLLAVLPELLPVLGPF